MIIGSPPPTQHGTPPPPPRAPSTFGLATSTAEVVAEAGGWSIYIPGFSIAADGATLDEAVTEMVGALREYAQDWVDRLAPSHRHGWGLVRLVALSDDEQLAAWITRGWERPDGTEVAAAQSTETKGQRRG